MQTKIVERSFQGSWFKQWPFLHYDEAEDSVYCHTCCMAFKLRRMKTTRADPAFISVKRHSIVQYSFTSQINIDREWFYELEGWNSLF